MRGGWARLGRGAGSAAGNSKQSQQKPEPHGGLKRGPGPRRYVALQVSHRAHNSRIQIEHMRWPPQAHTQAAEHHLGRGGGVGGWVALVLLLAGCATPTPLTATVDTSATKEAVVGGRAQLVVKVTNTGPLIPHLGLVFLSADKWYEHHTVSDNAGCTVDASQSAFDCGDLQQGATGTYSIAGVTKDAGTFHYQLALKELVHPYDFVNDHTDGADSQSWDETVLPA